MLENTIVACGQEMDIGCRVIKWNEPNGLSFYATKKYTGRTGDLCSVRKEIKNFILHHSVTYTAKHTHAGLISRGLSVNFIIDDNVDKYGFASIYQCLDIKDAGWSHAPLNRRGPGVEICYQPMVSTMAQAYSEANQKRYGVQPHPIITDKIHGQAIKAFAPTEAQIKSTVALLRGFVELFPEVPAIFPKDKDGKVIKTAMMKPEEYEGFLTHYQITRNKIDPLGLDLNYIEESLKTLRDQAPQI